MYSLRVQNNKNNNISSEGPSDGELKKKRFFIFFVDNFSFNSLIEAYAYIVVVV